MPGAMVVEREALSVGSGPAPLWTGHDGCPIRRALSRPKLERNEPSRTDEPFDRPGAERGLPEEMTGCQPAGALFGCATTGPSGTTGRRTVTRAP